MSRRGLTVKTKRCLLAGLVATIILGLLCDIAGAQQNTIEARKYNQKGRVYYNQGNYAKAIEEFQRAIRQAPNDVEARANLASAYERLDLLAEAEREITIAITQRPDRAASYGVRGAIFAKRGKREEAIGMFKKELALKPTYWRRHADLGRLYEELGRLAEARLEYELYLASAPVRESATAEIRQRFLNLGSPHQPSQQQAALAASTPAIAKTPSQVFEEVSASIVVVEAYGASATQIGQGSGVIIAPGEVATNCHVLKDADRLQVRHGQVRHPARVRLSDAERDLCQIAAAGLTARPAAIGATKVLKVGSRVYAVGAPKGLELTLSEGIVSGLREVAGGRFIQTTAPISPGSSGGGLFDEHGALVGLTTFYVSEGQNLNFALPVEWLRELHARHKTQTPAKDSTVGWLAKALALQSGQDWEGFLAHARQWVNAQPKDANAWYGLGYAYGQLNQWAKAVDAFQQALRLNPEDAGAWYSLGAAYGKLGQWAKAVDASQQALRLNPEDANAWYNLGWAYAGMGQWAKAVEAYQQAIHLNPEDANAWNNLGVAYFAMGRRDKVMEVYRRLKGLDAALAEQFFQKVVLP